MRANQKLDRVPYSRRFPAACCRELQIIGEAAKYIPAEIVDQYPDIPWKEMAGMRDKLIHFYFGVDYQLVWKTIKERLPQVKPEIQKIQKALAE